MNWTERIEVASEHGKFNNNDYNTACNGFTSSLGERLKILHGDKLTREILWKYMANADIEKLVLTFVKSVRIDNITTARQIHNKLKKIEMIT